MRLTKSILLATFCVGAPAIMWNEASGAPLQRIEEKDFGKMPDGTAVKVFTLRNAKGMSAKVITYGAIISAIRVPDRKGATTNVLLGTDNLDQYLKGFRGPAAVIG